MFDDHYIEWRNSRVNCLLQYINKDYFIRKTLLELGCGYADLGNIFYNLGCIVTSSDARKEYLDIVNSRYPLINTMLLDADKDIINNKYDIILHWGLLYHLNSIEQHLNNVCNKCNILLLETEVLDSNESIFINTTESGYDQAYNGSGIRPSARYIENILEKNNFNYIMITDNLLNANIHKYDWIIQNTNTWSHGLRRFWICWNKNIESPIK